MKVTAGGEVDGNHSCFFYLQQGSKCVAFKHNDLKMKMFFRDPAEIEGKCRLSIHLQSKTAKELLMATKNRNSVLKCFLHRYLGLGLWVLDMRAAGSECKKVKDWCSDCACMSNIEKREILWDLDSKTNTAHFLTACLCPLLLTC